MNVPSLQFLALAAMAAILFHLVRPHALRKYILLLVNIGFFLTFSPSNLLAYLPYLGFLAAGYVAMRRVRTPAVARLIFATLLLLFFWLKRYSFIPGPLLLDNLYVTIGLSYVFFKVMHLVIDAQQESLPVRPGLISYLNYTLNFTSLTSGPIQRYEDYHAFGIRPNAVSIVTIGLSLERIITGLFKVFVISAGLIALQGQLIDTLLPTQSGVERLVAGVEIVVLYTLYIYFNFSGYTDVVIGVASWFGLTLPENFARAFQAENFLTFWNRWHMTLSTWLKTYVYQPLLVKLMGRFPDRRVETVLGVFALFFTFFLVGAWHGQTSSFLFYGVLQGAGVAANMSWQTLLTGRLGKKGYRLLCTRASYRLCARGLTFTWFTFTLLWFWSDWHGISALLGKAGPGVSLMIWPVLWVISGTVLTFWTALFERAVAVTVAGHPLIASRYTRTIWCTALLTITLCVFLLLNQPAPPIVYRNF